MYSKPDETWRSEFQTAAKDLSVRGARPFAALRVTAIISQCLSFMRVYMLLTSGNNSITSLQRIHCRARLGVEREYPQIHLSTKPHAGRSSRPEHVQRPFLVAPLLVYLHLDRNHQGNRCSQGLGPSASQDRETAAACNL